MVALCRPKLNGWRAWFRTRQLLHELEKTGHDFLVAVLRCCFERSSSVEVGADQLRGTQALDDFYVPGCRS
jgi:hypothetical protein